MIDLAAILLLGVFGALGAWRGALESGFRLAALVAGYAIAAHAGVTAGPRLADGLGLAPWVGAPLAATGAFLASQILFGVGAVLIRSAERRRLAERPRPAADRAAGAVFGLVRGTAVVLLVGWLLLFADALRATGVARAPDLSGAALPALAGRVAEGTARLALGDEDPGARVAAALAGRPAETAERLRSLVEHPRLLALQQDAGFWSDVEHGDVGRALDRTALRRLAADASLRRELAALGVIDARAAESPDAFRAALGEALEAIGPRVRAVRRDPAARRLLEDPEVQRLLEARDAPALLAREDFRALVSRVLEAGA